MSAHTPDTEGIIQRTKKPLKVRVWGHGAFDRWKAPLIVINQTIYQNLTLTELLLLLWERCAVGDFVFMQNGATPQPSNKTQKIQIENLPEGHFLTKEERPPSLPDMNSQDFSTWSVLKAHACKLVAPNCHTVIHRTEFITPQFFKSCCNSMLNGMGAIVHANGDHIEGLQHLRQ